MSDDLFHNDPNNNPNNENRREDSQQPLENVNFNIHTYAGEVITNESYKVLQELLYNGYTFVEGMKLIESDIDLLQKFGVVLHIKDGCIQAGAILETTNFDSPEEKERYAQINMGQVEDVLDEAEARIRQQMETDFSVADIEKTGVSALLALSNLRYKLNFFITRENTEHQTDIAAAINTMTPVPDSVKSIFDELGNMNEEELSRFKEENLDLVKEQLVFPDVYSRCYTSLSPHFLRALIVKLDSIRANFVIDVQSTYVDKDQIISILKDYDDSALTAATEQDYINMAQDDYDITLTWPNHALSSVAVLNNQVKLGEAIAPIKKLLQELGGDLSYSVDRYEIKMTISCPKTEGYDDDLCRGIPNRLLFSMCRGHALIQPRETPVKLIIGYDPTDKSKTFFLVSEKQCIDDAQDRENLINLLSFCTTINSNNSLHTVTVMRPMEGVSAARLRFNSLLINGLPKANTPEEDMPNITINTAFLSDEESMAKLLNIIQSNKCAILHLATNALKTHRETIEALDIAIAKAHKLTDRELFIKLASASQSLQILQIFDPDGFILINGIYDYDLKRFFGRCHSDLVTKRLINIFDDIVGFDGGRATKVKEINENGEFIANLTRELRKHGITASERFQALLIGMASAIANQKPEVPLFQLINSKESFKKVPFDEFYMKVRLRLEFDVICVDVDNYTTTLDAPYIYNLEDPLFMFNHQIE